MLGPSDINLLVVDDDSVDVEAVVRAVRRSRLPFGLYTSKSAEEGLEVLRRESNAGEARPFLILLDLNMPGTDGFEFLETLRSDEQLKRSVVFVLSTSDHEDDRRRAYGHLVAGYMVKRDVAPRYDQLVELVAKYASVVRMPDAPAESD